MLKEVALHASAFLRTLLSSIQRTSNAKMSRGGYRQKEAKKYE
jgi:hypothetical protein